MLKAANKSTSDNRAESKEMETIGTSGRSLLSEDSLSRISTALGSLLETANTLSNDPSVDPLLKSSKKKKKKKSKKQEERQKAKEAQRRQVIEEILDSRVLENHDHVLTELQSMEDPQILLTPVPKQEPLDESEKAVALRTKNREIFDALLAGILLSRESPLENVNELGYGPAGEPLDESENSLIEL